MKQLFYLMLICSTPALAQVEVVGGPPPVEVELDDAVVEVPLVRIDGMPAVEVMLNGRGPFRFAVDWGANFNAVAPGVLQGASLPIIGKAVAGPGGPEMDIVQIRRLSIGSAHFSPVDAVVESRFDRQPFDGLLGVRTFKNILVTLDYPAGKIRFEKAALPESDREQIFDFTYQRGCPAIEVKMGSETLRAVLDTGAATAWIVAPASKREEWSFVEEPVESGRAIAGDMGEVETLRGRLDGAISFGAYTLDHPVVTLHEMRRPEILLGSGLLEHFAVTLDQQNQRVRFMQGEIGSDDSHSQDPAAELDAYMQARAREGFAGSLFVVIGSEVVLKKGYGMADRERGVPNTGETVFPIGSIVKPLTRTAVRLLEAEGKLGLSDPVTRFFDNVPEDKHAITIEHLLDHTSGLRAHHDRGGGDFERMTRDEAIERILGQQLRFEPGSDEAYSNSGYTLLAIIIEEITGRSYMDYIEANVLQPAGMQKTGFYQFPGWNEDEVAYGYNNRNGIETSRNSPRHWPRINWALMGNGGLAGPPEDLYRWIQHEREAGRITGPFMSAGGGDHGYVAVLIDLPERGTLIMMSNTDDDGVEDEQMMADLLRMAFGIEIETSNEPARTLSEDELEAHAFGKSAFNFIAAVNTNDNARVERFVADHMDDGFQQMPMENHLGFFKQVRDEVQNEPIVLKHIVMQGPYRLDLYAQSEISNTWLRITMEFNEGNPPRISGLQTREADPPDVE